MSRFWIALMVGLPLAVFGAETSGDESFYKQAAEGGMAEVQDGMLAQNKAQSQALKDFGAMMVKDHTEANDKLKGVADAKGVKLPAHVSPAEMASHKKLEAVSGDAFDKAYIRAQVAAHETTVALFRKEIANGADPAAKQFATETLPTVREHLTKIRGIAKDAGVAGK